MIKKGTLLNPAHVGLLASLGEAKVKVVRRPKVVNAEKPSNNLVSRLFQWKLR